MTKKSDDVSSVNSGLESYVVVVRVNTHCSLGCQFCGFSNQVQPPRRTIAPMTLEHLGMMLARYRTESGRPVHVSWLGGEPLQWEHWKSTSTIFADQHDLELGVTTNGLALASRSVRSTVLRLFRQITISVDGLAEHHDWLRSAPGLFQRLKSIVQTLNDMREPTKTLLRINTVLTRGNIDSFAEFAREIADWGVDELTFNALGGNDRPEFFPANRITTDQIERFADNLPAICHQVRDKGLTIRGSEAYLERLKATCQSQLIPIADCAPGSRFLFVDELGRASPCSFTSHCIGHHTPVTSTTSLEQLKHQLVRARAFLNPSACNDCHATHVYDKFR